MEGKKCNNCFSCTVIDGICNHGESPEYKKNVWDKKACQLHTERPFLKQNYF